MGTFVGHLVPGLALTLLGLWHTINNIRAYCLKGSTKFTVRFWYPLHGHVSRFKHLELIFILAFSLLAIFMQILDLPFIRYPFELDGLEHASIFFHVHLAIFAGFTLSVELTQSTEILSAFSGIIVASVFSQELFFLHFHSADHIGLEGHYHWLLQLIVLISILAAIAIMFLPTSLPAVLVLSVSVVFQGCWFMNMGFMLWSPQFVPRGCIMQLAESSGDSMHSAVTCFSHEADIRARALANLQFIWILSGIMIFTGFICLNFAGKCTRGPQSTEYEQLQIRGSDVPITMDSLKQADP
ncbi:LOW QUALITY PROTEIN: transmembrane epididymal protein 1-like [Hibiscus syriacus]|uniref:LOW QUALITY PROTEIN: transmembrane epididymal protein 1-like n=1 Tax=Hibiscus syriacus TaxID=106335 RepID=UPI001924FBDA|nr:LOW QUALITY PROTEIN: transmembrane epididymal protein 1-like [Hibiscus syriacus]